MPEAPLIHEQTDGTTTVKSACPYCGVGCGMSLKVAGGKIVKLSGDKDHPANGGRLCTKGTTAAAVLAAPGRLDRAYRRDKRGGALSPLPMAAALAETAARLRDIIDRHGPDAFAFYVSGQMSIEAQYLSNKLAKGFIGTNNIDSNSRLCMSSAASGYKLSLGADGPPGSYDDFDQTDCFCVIGSNMADCHPILFLRLLDRLKSSDARLIVVDPRRTATAEKAHLHLQIAPGTDMALLNGLLHLLIEHGDIDADFIAAHTEGWDAMPDFLAGYTPEKVASITGLAEADIRQAARWIGASERWISLWTMGLNQSIQGTWHTNALCNLHLATGKICKPGSGPFSLTGQPNAMGGREVGYLSHGLPGQRVVMSPADRATIEAIWQIPAGSIRAEPGLDTVSMFRAMREDRIKAVWIICTNPAVSIANRAQVIEGLRAAELVVVQDTFEDAETNAYADILLPGALWAEADGVLINSERNMTLTAKAVEPPGEAMADWRIIADVAKLMGYDGFDYPDASAVFDEIRQTFNPVSGYDIRGVSHARLRHTPLQWPCPPDGAARNPIRYVADEAGPYFPRPGGRAAFFARPWVRPNELPDSDHPFVLNTGRLPHQWHTRTKTGRVAALNRLDNGPFVEINPEDAQPFGIAEGDIVELRGRRGLVRLPAVVTDRVLPGSLFTTFHWNDGFAEDVAINALTDDARDAVSLQPALKFAAVALAKIADAPRRVIAVSGGEDEMAAVTLLWASQTGNAEILARELAERLGPAIGGVRVMAMADFGVRDLAAATTLLLVTSTYGDGEPPDNGRRFWQALTSDAAPAIGHLSYAVLALGDSSYAQFCGHGRALDARLTELGARSLAPRAECDGEDRRAAESWLAEIFGKLAPEGASLGTATTKVAGYGKHRPYPGKVVANRLLNGAGATKEVRHYAIAYDEGAITYEPGDALGVMPSNCPELAEEMCRLMRCDPAQPVTLPAQGEMALGEALTRHLDIARITPAHVEWVAEATGDTALQGLIGDTGRKALPSFLWGKQLPDLLRAYPVAAPLETWLEMLRPLQPRLYSISSSPKACGNEVHATISTVRFDCDGRARKGVASTFLADRADGTAPIFIQRTQHFRLPADPGVPVIMVGPGTGVAPFRAFLQERQAIGATGANWLFFGEQHAASDFYYREELEAMMKAGVLSRLDTAFSRDQSAKIYVQNRMAEQGSALWAWLEDGAAFYVCGDAAHMARDVDMALHRVAEIHGGLSAERAAEYIAGLKETRRYLRDVY